jgi:hypothetical protein
MRKNTKLFSLRVDPETSEWVKAYAAKERRTINSQLNLWIEEKKKEDEKCTA